MFGALLIDWLALLASVCQKLGMCQVCLLGSIRDVSGHDMRAFAYPYINHLNTSTKIYCIQMNLDFVFPVFGLN